MNFGTCSLPVQCAFVRSWLIQGGLAEVTALHSASGIVDATKLGLGGWRMKQLIFSLALIGVSGKVFAQVSECADIPADDACVCYFAQLTEVAENTGVYKFTDTYREHGVYAVDVHFSCNLLDDSQDEIVSIALFGGSEKKCVVSFFEDGDSCTGLTSEAVFYENYDGKLLSGAKRELRDFMEGAGY